MSPIVPARNASPSAARATPIHSLRVTWCANSRSAQTVSMTRPPAIVACTSEIGASASAPTWNPHPAIAMRIPSVYHGFRKSANDVRSGRRISTSGEAMAPRCL